MKQRILIFGVSGLLGSSLLRYFSAHDSYDVYGTARAQNSIDPLPSNLHKNIFLHIDAENMNHLRKVFSVVRPDVVINCVGVVKQLKYSEEPLTTIPLNSLLPHRLADLAATCNARLIHISTDCVFSGDRGGYQETDLPDARDLYGLSKLMGEVDRPNAVT